MVGLAMLGLAACGTAAEPTWQLWVRVRVDGPAIEALKKDAKKAGEERDVQQFVNKWVYRAAFQTYQACFELKERELQDFQKNPPSGGRLTRKTSNSATATGPEGSFTLDMACVPSDSWWVWWQEVQDQWARR